MSLIKGVTDRLRQLLGRFGPVEEAPLSAEDRLAVADQAIKAQALSMALLEADCHRRESMRLVDTIAVVMASGGEVVVTPDTLEAAHELVSSNRGGLAVQELDNGDIVVTLRVQDEDGDEGEDKGEGEE